MHSTFPRKLAVVRFIGALLFAVAAIGCGEQQQAKTGTSKQLGIVCTTGMVADLVGNIGGERVAVVGLMGPGVDPHYYKASQGDIQRLAQADLVFYNGLFLEGKMEEIFTKMARKKTVVAISRDVPEDLLRKPAEFGGHFDPHIWFDVSLWSKTVATVVKELSAADPAGAEIYARNGADYADKLVELHQWVIDQVQTIPTGQRVLVTAHDAFGYFGQAYGIEVMGLQGISTVAEYGVNDVNRLVDIIVERQVRAIFVESSIPERSINAVREGCRAKGLEVEVGGTLYSDAMGGTGSGADTYIGMVQSNVGTLVGALR
ncbi:MAG: manganese transporter [Candidatus Latescibacteria bacterium]|nr:manganese transporter [Candidatus Latescibacterota bacterium]